MKADAIIVLGAPVLAGGIASRTLKRRVLSGIALYKQGVSQHIIFSGAACRGMGVEAKVMADLACQEGVPLDAVFQETEAKCTFENLKFSQTLMTENGWSQAVVVSDEWHLPRARFCAQRIGLSAEYHGASHPGYEQGGVRKALCRGREAIAMVKYRLFY